MKKLIALAALTVAVSGGAVAAGEGAEAVAGPAAAAAASSEPKLALGYLMKQGGKLVFAPCRDRSYALLQDVSPGNEVTAALNGIGLEAGKRLYVELFAVLDGNDLKASALNFARVNTSCQMPGGDTEVWRAAGNHPGWNLVAGGKAVTLTRANKKDVSVPYVPFTVAGNKTTFEGGQGAGKLTVHFDKGLCKADADTVFGWTATVTAGSDTVKGCAWQR